MIFTLPGIRSLIQKNGKENTFDKFQCTLNKLIFSDTELFDFKALFTI